MEKNFLFKILAFQAILRQYFFSKNFLIWMYVCMYVFTLALRELLPVLIVLHDARQQAARLLILLGATFVLTSFHWEI